MRKIFVIAACLMLPLGLVAGETGKLRELDAAKLKVDFEKGRINKPTIITNIDEFAKAIPDAEATAKKIDFSKEKAILFAWGGSGGDKLTARSTDDDKTVIFTYKGGLTRDF